MVQNIAGVPIAQYPVPRAAQVKVRRETRGCSSSAAALGCLQTHTGTPTLATNYTGTVTYACNLKTIHFNAIMN